MKVFVFVRNIFVRLLARSEASSLSFYYDAAKRSYRGANQSNRSVIGDRRSRGLVAEGERWFTIRPAGIRQFSEITFASFATLKYGVKPRAGFPIRGSAQRRRMNIECRQFFRICVGFPRRPSFVQTLVESSYDKAISFGDPRRDFRWICAFPVNELDNSRRSARSEFIKLRYSKKQLHILMADSFGLFALPIFFFFNRNANRRRSF